MKGSVADDAVWTAHGIGAIRRREQGGKFPSLRKKYAGVFDRRAANRLKVHRVGVHDGRGIELVDPMFAWGAVRVDNLDQFIGRADGRRTICGGRTARGRRTRTARCNKWDE